MQIENKIYRRVSSDKLRSDTYTRRGRYVVKRGRCVSCYVLVPTPESGGGRKSLMSNGDPIPQTTLACDVCRVLLCRDCFYDGSKFDHRTGGHKFDIVKV